jgi:Rtf2 RING-finger
MCRIHHRITESIVCHRFVCPVTNLPCERYPTSALVPCGHAFSDRALREAPEGRCGVCSAAFDAAASDVVPLNGTPEQLAERRARLPLRQKKRKRKLGADAGDRAAKGPGLLAAGMTSSGEGPEVTDRQTDRQTEGDEGARGR